VNGVVGWRVVIVWKLARIERRVKRKGRKCGVSVLVLQKRDVQDVAYCVLAGSAPNASDAAQLLFIFDGVVEIGSTKIIEQ